MFYFVGINYELEVIKNIDFSFNYWYLIVSEDIGGDL